jgi:DNA-binding XRE family transcriptional regulator
VTTPRKYPLSKVTLAHLVGVGENLSLMRRSLGLTQASMAKAADMGTSTLISIEKGSPEVSLRHWLRAMEVLGLQTGVQGFGSMGPNAEVIEGMAKHVPKRGGGRARKTSP